MTILCKGQTVENVSNYIYYTTHSLDLSKVVNIILKLVHKIYMVSILKIYELMTIFPSNSYFFRLSAKQSLC